MNNFNFLDKALDFNSVVETLNEAAAKAVEFEGEFAPTQPRAQPVKKVLLEEADVTASQDGVEFWTDFNLEGRKAELAEARAEVERQAKRGTATPAVLQHRAQAAEGAFLGLAAALLAAPDPAPLLRASADLTFSLAEAQKEAKVLRAELGSAQLDSKETDAVVGQARQLEAANKELRARLQQELESKAEAQASAAAAQDALQRDARLTADLASARSALSTLQAEHERTQSALFELQARREEATAARQHDAEVAAEEAERAHRRIRDLEHEREALQQRVAAQTAGSGRTSAGDLQAALEAGQVPPDGLVASLRERLDAATAQQEEQQGEHGKALEAAHAEASAAQQQAAALQAELERRPTPEEFRKVRERVEMLRTLVDSQMEADDGGKELPLTQATLHSVLQERNRRLAAEKTALQRSLDTAQEQAAELSKRVGELERAKARQAELISRLEEDLLNTVNNSTGVPQREGAAASSSDALSSLAGESGSAGPERSTSGALGGSGGGDDSPMMGIVTSQRDRFRKRVLQLEEELRVAADQLKEAQVSLAGAQKDNVTLYEKIRFLERFQKKQAGAKPSGIVKVDGAGVIQHEHRLEHRLACGPFSIAMNDADQAQHDFQSGALSRSAGGVRRRGLACFGDDGEEGDEEMGKGPTEQKYAKAYEARINPFAEFQQSESEQRVKRLAVHDRAILGGSKLLLANRVARLFVAAYLVLLHAFVIIMLYYTAWSGSTITDMEVVTAAVE